jgi:hypothetical protein
MIKRAVAVVAGFLGVYLSLSAEQTQPANTVIALNSSNLQFPSLTLSDTQPFSFAGAVASASSLSWTETLPPSDVILAPVIVTGPRRVATVSAAPAEDPSKEVVAVRKPYFDYAGGEVGAFYGSSSGKFGREVEAGYILGEVGNEHMQISAGASYEHSSGRVQRFSR